MALQSITNIFIGSYKIRAFKELKLTQKIDAHHTLTLICRMDVLESVSDELAKQSKGFLGETITLQIRSFDDFSGYKELAFKGVVSQVKTVKGFEIHNGNTIVITAKSPSILVDDGPNFSSYNDVSLSEIVSTTFGGYDASKVSFNINPKNDATLHYSVQHNESAFSYVSRLAAQYGEWFYHNGKELVFGKPDTEETPLQYGFDLKEYELNLNPQSNNYNFFANDYLASKTQLKSTTSVNSNLNGFVGFASDKSKKMYLKETKVWHNSYNDSMLQQRLDTAIEIQKKATEVQQITVSGLSDNPGVTLGSIVKIEGVSYRITKVTHTNNEIGDYENVFEGVTTETDVYPKTNINAFPKSDTQTAIVKENNDPDGLGRVKVKFPWQQATTPWIRIVLPHSGGDKGFHFIPEVGEEVLIGFEGGNAEHPYVLGSLYNGGGAANAFKTDKNDVKAIRTRSGHTIELNDTNGSEFIEITDKKGNLLTIDTVGETITINALKNININAGENINITAGKNFSVSAGENISESAGQNVSVTAGKDMLLSATGNMTEMSDNRTDAIEQDFTRSSTKSDEYAGEVSVFSTKENMTMQSAKTVNINSAEKSKLF